MAGRRGQHTDSDSAPRGSFPSLRVAGPPALLLAIPEAAQAESIDLGGRAAALFSALPPVTIHNAATLALFLGPIAVATILAVLLMRERRLSAQRDRRLNAEVARLRAVEDRSQLLFGSERQLLISWSGRDGEPRFEGDPSVAGEGATAKRALAFGGWLAPADAAAVEGALDHLRHRGEAFRLTARTLAHAFVDVEGRTLGGNAILRLRDVTGDRSELLRTRADLSASRNDLRALTALADTIAHPLWIRDAAERLSFANQAFLRAVDAASVEDAASRSLELLDRPTREEARRCRAAGAPFDARVAALIGGRRHVLDAASGRPERQRRHRASTSPKLESMRAELKRQRTRMCARSTSCRPRVAIFNADQRLTFYNAAYRALWELDRPSSTQKPTDGEVLDRLRAPRKLPEQPDFRRGRRALHEAYRAPEPREHWWHLPDGRTLRVVTTPTRRAA